MNFQHAYENGYDNIGKLSQNWKLPEPMSEEHIKEEVSEDD